MTGEAMLNAIRERDHEAMEALRAHPGWTLSAREFNNRRTVSYLGQTLASHQDPAEAILVAVEVANNKGKWG